MKLLIAIVSESDAPAVTGAMSREGFPSTVTNGVGGFLNRENRIIIAGVDNRRVDYVLDIIRSHTDTHEELVPSGLDHGKYALPEKIKVGGASVFVVDVDRFVKL